LFEENSTLPDDQCVLFDQSFGLRSGTFDRKRHRISCAAEYFDRASVTFWLPHDTNQRAEIEQCGVEGRGLGFWKNTRGVSPKGSASGRGIDGFPKIKEARQNASAVGFNNWNGSIEREGRHRVRSIFTDAWQLLHSVG
jgi:hypothetical protein